MSHTVFIFPVRAATLLVAVVIAGTFASFASPRIAEAKADVAEPKDERWWFRRHRGFAQIARQDTAQVVFLGDSITATWGSVGKDVFMAEFGQYRAANFGIGGDRTEHVLWRVQNGEFPSDFTPKVVVLMIGTNNLAEPEGDIANGIRLIVNELNMRAPSTKILLHGIFPKGDEARWAKVKRVNAIISQLHTPRNGIYYLDIGAAFTNPDGTFNRSLFVDDGHLNADGYQVWANNIRIPLANLVSSGGVVGGEVTDGVK
jgi:lysophospholipase L1-like esterase